VNIFEKLIQRFILSDTLPIEARRINSIFVVAMFGLVVDFIFRVILQEPSVRLFLAMGIIYLSIIAGMVIANKYNLFHAVTWFTTIVICDILFPIAFFLFGGIRSSVPIFFVLSIVVIFIMMEGKTRIVTLAIHIAVIILCFYIGVTRPDLFAVMTEDRQAVDQIKGIVIVGLCIGAIYLFQAIIATRERDKTNNALTELAQERTTSSALLDANPDFNIMISDKFEVIDCNMTAVKLLGKQDKESFKKDFLSIVHDAIPELQADGSPSISLFDRINETIAQGSIQFNTTLILQNEMHTFYTTMSKVPFRNTYAIMLYLMDITRLYNIQQELLHREKLLVAVNTAAEELITSDVDNPRNAILKCMAMIGEQVGIDRINIWQSAYTDDAGDLWYRSHIGWDTPSLAEQNPFEKAIDTYPYVRASKRWQAIFDADDILNSSVADLPPAEQENFRGSKALATLFIPIHVQDRFWGFTSFDRSQKDTPYTKEEISILKSCALLMANAYLRSETLENLIEAREEALRSAKAKSDFLANMSHEIRTPLNAVIGMTSIGLNNASVERKDYCFDKIEEASKHLLGVINDILDMSKIEADKLELASLPFNFEKMLQHAVTVSAFRIDEKAQRLLIYIDEKIPDLLLGDDLRLAQVVTNLLSNAVKFSPEGASINVDARLIEAEDEDGFCRIRVEVKDTGIGISDEQKAKLFSPFQQADGSTSRNFGGTGLGLAISKRIIELMEGEIWVESEEGMGSSFFFTVRLKHVEAQEIDLYERRRSGVNFRNLRVLFVDDDSNIREYFEDIANRFGFNCDIVSNGAEALGMIRSNPPYDICFVDWKMPNMDGIELSRAIRSGGETHSIIVMISAHEAVELEEAAKSAGVDHFLAKPLFPSSITNMIVECLGAEAAVDTATNETTSDAPEDFSGYRILLAEDVEINREIVIAVLEPLSLEIECAANGRETVKKFTDDPSRYDLIFMDVQMPEMDGYEATRLIRDSGLPRGKEIPIIAMTANVFREDIEQCLAVGMNEHIGKPLNFVDVIALLRKYLKRES